MAAPRRLARSYAIARQEFLAAAEAPGARVVHHLHPDRGGEWTPARERLWHEVQAAWAARDADWLARLETDWESAHATLQPDSPLSHLRRQRNGRPDPQGNSQQRFHLTSAPSTRLRQGSGGQARAPEHLST